MYIYNVKKKIYIILAGSFWFKLLQKNQEKRTVSNRLLVGVEVPRLIYNSAPPPVKGNNDQNVRSWPFTLTLCTLPLNLDDFKVEWLRTDEWACTLPLEIGWKKKINKKENRKKPCQLLNKLIYGHCKTFI